MESSRKTSSCRVEVVMAASMAVEGVVITSPGLVRDVVYEGGFVKWEVGTYCGSRLRSCVFCPIVWFALGWRSGCLGSPRRPF